MNAKQVLAGGVTVAALLGAALAASAQNRLDETLRIGFIGGSSGENSALYQAAVLAAAQINDDNGVVATDNRRYGFEVLYYEADTQAEAVDALADAVADNVVAVLGPDDPTLAQAIQNAGTPDVPVLLGNPDAPATTSIYALSSQTSEWAQAAADYLANERQFDSIGMLTATTSSATDAHDAFEAEAGADAIVTDITFDADRTNFSVEAQTLRDSGAQAVFIWAREAQVTRLIEALEAARWEGVIVYGGAPLLDIETDSEVFSLTGWTSAAYDAASQAFVREYSARWNAQPEDGSAAYYDAVNLIAAAVDAGSATASSVNTWLRGTGDLTGVQGTYEGAQTDSVRLVQRSAGRTLEAAVYAGETCQNCPSYWLADTTGEDVDANGTLRLGLIVAEGDVTASTTASIEDAVRLAIREINAQGGLIDPDNTRYTLSLNVYEANSDEEAESALQEAADDGVQIVLGPDYNGQIMNSLNAAEDSSVLQLVTATSPQISRVESGDYVFQLRPTDESLAASAADYLTENLGLTRIATVAVNADYGVDGISAFESGIAASDDGEVLLALEHNVGETDLTEVAAQLVDSGVEAVAVWSTQPAASSLLSALDAAGWDGVFVYGYLTPEFVEQHSGVDVQVVGPVNWWSTGSSWATADFVARFEDRYNASPIPQSAAYYDAVYLVHDAVSESGIAVSDVRSWLLDQESYTGVQGDYTPATTGSGALTSSVLIVSMEDGAVSEASRYLDGACVAWCGD
ncbi:MAG: ABC transporter substrate-binding protein [Pleurocapsa minor GSE-CHR-MK-17-07R]|jgi:branched-chain amino acid transport system substrate-binding protein|nr:ABC transporter substrate-binding protein [Pleurocapsa minor GSE-CHR-MK 17-07R]